MKTTTVQIRGDRSRGFESYGMVCISGPPELTDEVFVDVDRPRRIVVHAGGVVDVFAFEYHGGGWKIAHETASTAITASIDEADGCVTVTGPIVDVESWDHWPPEEDEIHHALEDLLDHLQGEHLMTAYRSARRNALEKARADLRETLADSGKPVAR